MDDLSVCAKIARSDNMSQGITHLNSQVMEKMDTVCMDQFSGLPEDAIHNILSRLPMKTAAQTTLLSSNWRQPNVILNNPNLEFKLSPLNTADIVPLINNYMAAYMGPQIHTFRVYGISHEDISKDIVKWVSFAVAKHVKVLHVDVCMDRGCDNGYIYFDVPASLFSCDSIESLTLDKCVCSPPLGFKGFPSLKTLCLRNTRISAETVAEVLSKSPLLEKLWLYEPESISFLKICAPTPRLSYISVRVDHAKGIEICAPGLQFLDLNGNLETFHVSAPRLVRAHFPNLLSVDRGSGDVLRDWASSVAKISNVYVLNANMHFLMLLYADCYMNGRNPRVKFQNLMSFHVIGDLDETYGVSALVNFFRDCPRLTRVIIEPRTPVFGGNWVCEHMRMEPVRPIIITDKGGGGGSAADAEGFSDYNDLVHLKTIIIRGFTGSQGQMKLLKFLLEKAVVLGILSLEWEANVVPSPDVVKELAKASHAEIREHFFEEFRIGGF